MLSYDNLDGLIYLVAAVFIIGGFVLLALIL